MCDCHVCRSCVSVMCLSDTSQTHTQRHTKTHRSRIREYVQNVICYLHVHTNNIYIPYKMHMRVHKPTPYACTHANSQHTCTQANASQHTEHKPTPHACTHANNQHTCTQGNASQNTEHKPTPYACTCTQANAVSTLHGGLCTSTHSGWPACRESRVVAAPTTRLTDHAAAATWLHLWGSFSLSCLTETQKRHTSQ